MNNLSPFQIKIINLGLIEYASIFLLATALIFSIYAIYKRLSNVSKWRRFSLIFIHLLVFISIIGLIFQPQYRSKLPLKVRLVTNSNIGAISNISTPGYLLLNESNKKQLVDKLTRDIYQNKILHTADQLLLKHPLIDEIEIIGDGLTESQWQHFQNIKINYLPPRLKEGIIYPNWNSLLNLGDSLNFTGRFQSNSENAFTARLLNPADDVITEVAIQANQLIQLSAQPKLAGQHQYRIQILDSQQDIVTQESITVSVTENSSAKILIIQSSPSFETKQLQNWAAENGAQVLIRTQISKDHFTTRSTNIIKEAIKNNFVGKLNRQLLDQFDLAIVDGRALTKMSKGDLNELLASINAGLGFLVLVDQTLLKLNKDNRPSLLANFQLSSLEQPLEVTPYLVNNNLTRKPASESFIPLAAQSISSTSKDQVKLSSIIETSNGHMLVAKQNVILGNISVSLLQETYRLVTSGENTHYSMLWQHLIKSIGRKKKQTKWYTNNNQLIFKNTLAKICYQYFNSKTSEIPNKLHVIPIDPLENSIQEVQLQFNPFTKNHYCGYFWPKKSGWHTASFLGSQLGADHFYVSKKDRWLASQQAERIKATLAKQANFVFTQRVDFHYKDVNPWIFWWVLFVSASLVWLERKLYKLN